MSVYFNHIYFVVSSKQYNQMKKDEYLTTRWAEMKERTVETVDGRSWTGLYFYGKNTYIEVFEEGEQWTKGTVGIAIGIEEVGGTAKLLETIKERKVPGEVHNYWNELPNKDNPKDGEPLKWFNNIWVDHQIKDSLFNIWTMEYGKEYMDLYCEASQEEDISRLRNLAKSYNKDKDLLNVKKVNIFISEAESDWLEAYFKALDYIVTKENNVLIIKAPEVELHCTINEANSGVASIEFFMKDKTEFMLEVE